MSGISRIMHCGILINMLYYCTPCSITDNDECSNGESMCTGTCTNIPGGYECTCDMGYELADDGYTCEGKTIKQFNIQSAEIVFTCLQKRCNDLITGPSHFIVELMASCCSQCP